MASLRTAGRTAGLVLAAGLVVGCQQRQPRPAPAPAGPPPMQAAMELRRSLMQADPNARIGVVAAAVPSAQLVAVNDVPAGEFREGQTVQFIDGNGDPIAVGYVRAIKGDVLHVLYDVPDGTRAPGVGDLAMRLDSGVDTGVDMAGGAAEPAPAEDGDAMEAAVTVTETEPEPQPTDEGQAEPAVRPQRRQAQADGASRLPPRRSAATEAAPTEAVPTEDAPVETAPAGEGPDMPAEEPAATDVPQPEAQPEAERPSLNEEAGSGEFQPAEGSDAKPGLPPVDGGQPAAGEQPAEVPAGEEMPAAEEAPAEQPAAEQPAAEEAAAEETPDLNK